MCGLGSEHPILEVHEKATEKWTDKEKDMISPILIYGILICGAFFVLGFFKGINFERNRQKTREFRHNPPWPKPEKRKA